MRALFVGMGSIGQRHLRNYKDLVGPDVEIFALRKTNHNLIIENGLAQHCESLAEHYGYESVATLEDGLALKPDVVFITNPSSMHLDVALAAARAGCNLFIEKPLSHNLEGLEELQSVVDSNNSVVSVGYQTRYHPCYKDVESILLNEDYGSLISAGFEWGTYLPDHHPYEDYREGYAANNSLGGGVTLGLIHEIDLLYSFFGVPKTISAIGGHLSSLDMKVDDTVSVLMGFDRNKKLVPVNMFLSYAQTYETRTFRMQFNEGLLLCDLVKNSVVVYGLYGSVLHEKEYGHVDRNKMYKVELSNFIEAVRRQDTSENSLKTGVDTLSIALKIRGKIDEFCD